MRLVLLLLLGLLVTAPAAATPEQQPTAIAITGPDLSGDVVVPERPLHARGSAHTYPGSRIRYHESVPAKWQWSLDRAIAHWNGAGGDIRFVEVPRDRAQLTIGYGDTQGYDGLATLGPAPGAFVRLSPAYKDVDATDPLMRVWVGRLFAHELGHSLGFGHTTGSCSLMVPVFDMGRCPLLADDEPGYYYQRWIDSGLLRRFIDAYDGEPRRPAVLAPIAPLPPTLEDLAISGGAGTDGPVTLTWKVPRRSAPGTRVEVTVWEGPDCRPGERGDQPSFDLPVSAGLWEDPVVGQGTWCYLVQVANRYGAARFQTVEELERWAPVPDPPEVSYLGWDEAAGVHRFSSTVPRGTDLVVQQNLAEPEVCLTAYDADVASPVWEPDPTVAAGAPRECLVFFLVSRWDTVSDPLSITVETLVPGTDPG